MKDFITLDGEPSEFTLHIIRTIAYNFSVVNQSRCDDGRLHWN